MKFHNNRKIQSKYWLLILTGICLGLIAVSAIFDDAFAPLRYVTGVTIAPMQKGVNAIGLWIDQQVNSAYELKELKAENQELKEQLAQIQQLNRESLLDEQELQDLRQLYELDQQYPNYNKIAANVIAKDGGNWFDTFIIDKGTKDGIQVNCNVLCDDGLAGIVIEAGPNYAKVRSIIDDTSTVSAMFLTDNGLCSVIGDEKYIDQGYIHVERIDKDIVINEGDQLITSNVSDKFLPGLPIGYIYHIQLDSNNLTKSGDVKPMVDFEHLHRVLVILDVKGQEIEQEQ